MIDSVGTFPFGQPIRRVVQTDRSAKRVFVLGVYASAVHARWIGPDGKEVVRALGVASEPYIFWRGDGTDEIISRIEIPAEAGSLVSAGGNLNGPSGRSLDDDFIRPLGIGRDQAWLCDLVPHSCMNAGQARAIKEHYAPVARRLGLPDADWATVPKKLADEARCREIAEELRESKAEILVTLGDKPLKWFGATFGTRRTLGAYGREFKSYGSLHDVKFDGRPMKLLPLVHPRQAARLGSHSRNWAELHRVWKESRARGLLG